MTFAVEKASQII